MAPSHSRHLLIWSLPSLALLFGFLLYRRRKGSLRIDPGGTKTKKIVSETLQTNGKVDSDKKVSVKPDEEVSKSLFHTLSDDEYTVDDLKFSDNLNGDSECSNSSEFKVNIEVVNLNKISTPKDNYFGEISEFINISDDTVVGLMVSPIKDCEIEADSADISNAENKVLELRKTVKVAETDQTDSSNTDVKGSGGDSVINDLNTTNKQGSISTENSTGIVVNKQIDKTEASNGVCMQGVNDTNSISQNRLDNKCNLSVKNMAEEDNNSVHKAKEEGVLSIHMDQGTITGCDSDLSKQKDNSVNITSDKDSSEANMVDSDVGHMQQVHEDNSETEQKLVTLGIDQAHTADRTERDSANHSPADVMLASPSISNYSDAHSEGSSDSGKGCSDVATPAGGSSVAGDQIPCVYEFVLEQQLVGRLIGRHGSYLHDIRTKTHTNIFIKRHPETSKLKICAIEGTQQDIDTALAMIRQKFPLRRFPTLTLEKVSFVPTVPVCPLRAEAFHLQLVEGVNNDVLLSSLISAAHFFLQQPTHPSYQSLSALNVMMTNVYNSPEAPALTTPVVDAICAAPTMGGWYRAQIISVDEKSHTCDIKFLDYGGYLTIDASSLRQIRGDFLMLPFQAIECYLANVVPAGGEGAEWSEEAKQFVQCLTQQQLLQAQVYSYTDTGIPLVYLYSTQCTQNGIEVVLINQDLVARGYADMLIVPEE